MLTAKENFLETIRGGKPERFVKQFEFFPMPYMDPYNATNPVPYEPGQSEVVDFWGVTWSWPEDSPGAFPVHGPGKTVLEDIEDWKNIVHAPEMSFSEDLWKAAEEEYASYDRNEVLLGPTMFPGLFEMTHMLMGMENAMISLHTNPEEMHELINYIADWEIGYISQLKEHLHPDLVFHHDDWGSSKATFLSPDMFREFYLEPYKRLYGCYKENGFLVFHHSDSYAASYVPFMIEMGVDVWQGGTVANNIPELVKKYGGQISFLTGIDSQIVDREDWSFDEIESIVRDICKKCGPLYFCPCQTAGLPMSTYDGVYDAIDKAIDVMSEEMSDLFYR